MTFLEKLDALKTRIKHDIGPLIDNDYVLWDCPYHSNIGDTLIWEGERAFLKELPYKCIGYASYITCTFPDLSPDVIILLQEGGNFGDLWRCFQDFRLQVIRRYPHNRIVILPQSVSYETAGLMEEDARVMAGHKQLTICVRDKNSYELVKNNFENPVLLVPDMAFYISPKVLAKFRKKEENKVLFLKRGDKELVSQSYHVEENGLKLEVRDWPTQEKGVFFLMVLYRLSGICQHLRRWKAGERFFARLTNGYAARYCRITLLKRGIGFVSSYKYVYTTRLHVMILSVLLEKECEFFDNSYGKNMALYNTWLKDLSGVKPANS